MAYKFQLGTAKLSGSVQALGDVSSSADLIAVDITASGDIDVNGITLADASGLAGDALADNGGKLDVQLDPDGAIEISGSGLVVKADQGLLRDSQGLKVKIDVNGGLQATGDGIALSQSVAGDGLSLVNGVLGVNVDNSSIEISGDAIQVMASGITNDMLSGSIDINKLEYSTISGVSLGNSLFTLSAGNGLTGNDYDGSGNETFSVQVSGSTLSVDAGGVKVAGSGITNNELSGNISADKLSLNLNQFSSSAGQLNLKPTISGSFTFSNDITIGGNLVVNGDTFSASVGTLLVEDALITIGDGDTSLQTGRGFEIGSDLASFKTANEDLGAGAADIFKSSLPLSASAVAAANGIFGDASAANELTVGSTWTVNDTHISGNAPVSASAFYGDGSGLSGVAATDLQFGTALLTANASISQPLTRVNAASAVTVTLPAITNADDGKMYVIKNVGTTIVTISSSAHQIEGASQTIALETQGAAVTLFAVVESGSPAWIIV